MEMNTTKIATSRFGEISAPADRVITMMKPVLGFEGHDRFVVIEREDCEPFVWLQSTSDPELAFLMINPSLFFREYEIEVNRREVEDIEAIDSATLETFVIISVGATANDLTANLQGPIVINTATRKAKQLVLANAGYSVAQPLFAESVQGQGVTESRSPVQV